MLDPDKVAVEQSVDFDNECESAYPFEGIIKIDMIDAQRGLADADSSNDVVSLSKQLRAYYGKHIDVNKATAPEDLDVLIAMQDADKKFSNTLGIKFEDAIAESSALGYPGITDPKITFESKLTGKSVFEHDSAVQYALSDNESDIRLSEKYNGLVRIAYQTPTTVTLNKSDIEVLSATFEDLLTYANLMEIVNLPENGVVAKIKKASKKTDTTKFNEAVYNAIHDDTSGKISFALDLTYQLETVSAPPYIKDGLIWLRTVLKRSGESAVSEGIVNDE